MAPLADLVHVTARRAGLAWSATSVAQGQSGRLATDMGCVHTKKRPPFAHVTPAGSVSTSQAAGFVIFSAQEHPRRSLSVVVGMVRAPP